MVKKKRIGGVGNQVPIKQDLKKFKEEIVDEFHVISEGLIDQIKLLAEGHSGIIERLNRMDDRLDRMEKENERQHQETRALPPFLKSARAALLPGSQSLSILRDS
jgi:hypothetical protein